MLSPIGDWLDSDRFDEGLVAVKFSVAFWEDADGGEFVFTEVVGDPTVKSLKLASLCSALWAERGVQLVGVGGIVVN